VHYARSFGGQDVRGVYIEIDPEKTQEALLRWSVYVPDIPLVILESPYRGIIEPLLTYIDEVEREREDDVITVILPEFVTEKWWTKLLHNQTGLMLKWALLFKHGVVVTNIRYYVDTQARLDHPLSSRGRIDAQEEPAAPAEG
jgi:hypothetical protein